MEKQIKRTILEQGRDWFESDRKVILARVIQTWGSSPCPVGSNMIVNDKGEFFGVSGGNIVSIVFNIPAVIPIDWAFIGLLVCSVIGIGFGIYPAWRAAQLDPIESLRFE